MSERFPDPCCRCGFCCLSEVCIVGREVYNVQKYDRCPGLSFDNYKTASCKLANGLVPVGDGCCMKARLYRHGIEHKFSKLTEHQKQTIADSLRGGRWGGGGTIHVIRRQ